MGYTWEIEVWTSYLRRGSTYYGYQPYWSGDSLIGAIWKLIKAKKEGYGCVTLHWR